MRSNSAKKNSAHLNTFSFCKLPLRCVIIGYAYYKDASYIIAFHPILDWAALNIHSFLQIKSV